MKDILIKYYEITNFVSGSPKEVLRQAYKANLIFDDRWMEMLKVRNEPVHDYDGEVIRESCNAIIETYIDLFYEFSKVVQKLLSEF